MPDPRPPPTSPPPGSQVGPGPLPSWGNVLAKCPRAGGLAFCSSTSPQRALPCTRRRVCFSPGQPGAKAALPVRRGWGDRKGRGIHPGVSLNSRLLEPPYHPEMAWPGAPWLPQQCRGVPAWPGPLGSAHSSTARGKCIHALCSPLPAPDINPAWYTGRGIRPVGRFGRRRAVLGDGRKPGLGHLPACLPLAGGAEPAHRG